MYHMMEKGGSPHLPGGRPGAGGSAQAHGYRDEKEIEKGISPQRKGDESPGIDPVIEHPGGDREDDGGKSIDREKNPDVPPVEAQLLQQEGKIKGEFPAET